MKVNSSLENASFELVKTADEGTLDKTTGRVYYNIETSEMLVGNSGATFTRFQILPALPTARPVGTIETSVLTLAQFNAESDGLWVLADGQSVVGTDYATLTGDTVAPDFRGSFLRGMNNGGIGPYLDPDGDKALASHHQDKTASNGLSGSTSSNGSHAHTIPSENPGGDSQFGFNSTNNGNDPQNTYPTSAAGSHSHTVIITGDNETAPVHAIVNYFVKVNY